MTKLRNASLQGIVQTLKPTNYNPITHKVIISRDVMKKTTSDGRKAHLVLWVYSLILGAVLVFQKLTILQLSLKLLNLTIIQTKIISQVAGTQQKIPTIVKKELTSY